MYNRATFTAVKSNCLVSQAGLLLFFLPYAHRFNVIFSTLTMHICYYFRNGTLNVMPEKNANVCCNMSFVLVPSWPTAPVSMAPGVQTVRSTRLCFSHGAGERGLWPRHDDTTPEEIIDPDTPPPALCTHCPLTKTHGLTASYTNIRSASVRRKLMKELQQHTN